MYVAVTAKDMERKWMEMIDSSDPDRASDYDKSYASKLQRLGDDFGDRDCRQDQSQQVNGHRGRDSIQSRKLAQKLSPKISRTL